MARSEEKNKAISLSSSVASAARTGAAVLPIGIGAGITAHSIYKTKSTQVRDIFRGTNSHAASHVVQTTRDILSAASQTSFREIGGKIKELNVGNLTFNQAKAAWEQAANAMTSGVTLQKWSLQMAKMQEMAAASGKNLTAADVRDFVSNIVSSNSVVGRRVATRFQQNLRGFSTTASNIGLTTIQGFRGTRSEIVRLNQLPDFYQSAIESLKQGVGASGYTLRRITRPGLEGKQLQVFLSGNNIVGGKDIVLNIPYAHNNRIAVGKELEAQYVVGNFPLVEGNKIAGMADYNRWAALRVQEGLLPRIQGIAHPTGASVARAVSEFHAELREPGVWTPQTFGIGVPTSYDILNKSLSSSLHFVHKDTGALFELKDKDLLHEIVSRHGNQFTLPGTNSPISFYPASPSRAGRAIFTSEHPGLSKAFGMESPLSRRPSQGDRPYWPSETARNMISKDKLTNQYMMLQGKRYTGEGDILALQRTPALRTLYTSGAVPKAGFHEGEFIVSRSKKGLLSTQSLVNPRINIKDMAEHILSGPNSLLVETSPGVLAPRAEGTMIPAGTVLGFTPEGELFKTEGRMKLLGGARFKSHITLAAEQETVMDKFMKFFGDVKGMGEFVSDKMMKKISKDLDFNKSVDAFMHMDTLRKDASLHRKQMFSALVEFNRENISSGKSLGRQRFNENWLDMFRHLERRGLSRTVQDERNIKDIVRLAKGIGVSPEQAGMIFGAIPAVHKIEEAAALSKFGIPAAWTPHIMKGQAYGISHIFSAGGENLSGSGTAKASIEARVHELLQSGTYNYMGVDVGELWSHELTKLRGMTAPEAELAKSAFYRTLTSINPSSTSSEGEALLHIKDLTKAHLTKPDSPSYLFGGEGKYIDFGGLGGLKKVFVPGSDHIKLLAEFRDKESQVIQSDITHSYSYFLETAARAANSPNNKKAQEAFSAAHDQFIDDMSKAHTQMRVGSEGVAGGKLEGSRFLRAVTPTTYQPEEDIFSIGISKKTMEDMVHERVSLLNLSKEAHSSEVSRWMTRAESTEGLGGWFLRHPLIGQYSVMPARFYVDKQLSQGAAHVPVVKKMIYINGKAEMLEWSMKTGTALDFDGDTVGAILGTGKMEPTLRGMASTSSEFSQQYEAWSIRQQLLKAKAASDSGISLAQAAKGDTYKSILSNEISSVSSSMRRAKAAMLHKGVTEDSMNALTLLEYLEQAPISGKHMKASTADQLAGHMKVITQAIETGEMSGLHSLVSGMLQENSAASQLLTSDLKVRVGSETGKELTLKSLNLEKTLSYMSSAITGFNEKFTSDLEPARIFRYSSGKGMGKINKKNIENYLIAQGQGLLGKFGNTFDEGGAKLIASKGLETWNKVAELGKGLLSESKPLLWGFGASLAISAALSMPKSTLDGGVPMASTQFNNSTGDKVTPQNIHPNPPTLGMPIPPRQPSGPAPIAKNDTSAMNIEAKSRREGGDFNTARILADQIRANLGANSVIKTRISDTRRGLTAQKLSDIMDR